MHLFKLLRISINMVIKRLKCGTSKIQVVKMYEIEASGFSYDKYIKLVIVYLKQIQYINTITEICPHLCTTYKYASH